MRETHVIDRPAGRHDPLTPAQIRVQTAKMPHDGAMSRSSAPRPFRATSRWVALPAASAALLVATGCGVDTPGGTSSAREDPATASTPASSSPDPTGPREFTVNVSGDLLWHDDLWASAELDAAAGDSTEGGALDFGPQLASAKDYISTADLAICHSEVPFAEEGGPYGSYPTFSAPPQIAETLAETGFDVCTTASNHTLDAGWDGLVRTVDAHEAAGVETVGSYRSEQDSSAPFLRTVDTEAGPVSVGIISQTFSLNGVPLPAGREWSVGMLDAGRAVEQARTGPTSCWSTCTPATNTRRNPTPNSSLSWTR